jgi:hypothetical protein
VEAEDGSEQTLDRCEASVSVKRANAQVVCGYCFAPKSPNRCPRCKVSVSVVRGQIGNAQSLHAWNQKTPPFLSCDPPSGTLLLQSRMS